jgi:hypothetical protein
MARTTSSTAPALSISIGVPGRWSFDDVGQVAPDHRLNVLWAERFQAQAAHSAREHIGVAPYRRKR